MRFNSCIMRNQSTCRLLQLPLEIREMIYDNYFVAVMQSYDPATARSDIKAFLLLCSQICFEATPQFELSTTRALEKAIIESVAAEKACIVQRHTAYPYDSAKMVVIGRYQRSLRAVCEVRASLKSLGRIRAYIRGSSQGQLG